MRNQTPAVLLFAGLALFPFAAHFGAAGLSALARRADARSSRSPRSRSISSSGRPRSFPSATPPTSGSGPMRWCWPRWRGSTISSCRRSIAVAAAALFAALTGYVSLRARGVYYIMSTLAFGQMLYFLFVSLSALGGDDGYTLSNRSRLFGAPRLTSDFAFYYLCARRACARLSAAGADRRFALRPRSQRDPAESLARSGAWLSAFPVPARGLRDRRARSRRSPGRCSPTRANSSRRPSCPGSARANSS